MPASSLDCLVVGAGFSGATVAERLASKGWRVLVLDRRQHIGGNAYDEFDSHGVLVHRYGPHIFHTNSARVLAYLSRFTDWRFYEHRVLARAGAELYPIPVNRTTLNRVFGLQLDSDADTQAFLETLREPRQPAETSEDVVLAQVGRRLCDMFFAGYTRKQWGRPLSALAPQVAARIPVRTNDDDRYFTDTYQFMPAAGYAAMFRRMLSHPNIEVRLGVDYFEARARLPRARHVAYTGALDRYFEQRYGPLPYRSLRFDHEHLSDVAQYQPVGTVNYPGEDVAFTRITEFKHLTGQQHPGTSIVREYPTDCGEPYYPVLTPDSEALLRRYQALADAERDTTFVGRLAQFRYYNMDQAVAAALVAAERIDAALAGDGDRAPR
jgi:UDP-galactopyranose mutase